jgi:hypothetical protein
LQVTQLFISGPSQVLQLVSQTWTFFRIKLLIINLDVGLWPMLGSWELP